MHNLFALIGQTSTKHNRQNVPEALDAEGQFSLKQILSVPMNEQPFVGFEQHMLPQRRHHFLIGVEYSLLDPGFIFVAVNQLLKTFLLEADHAGAADGGGGCELQAGALDQKFHVCGNVEYLS